MMALSHFTDRSNLMEVIMARSFSSDLHRRVVDAIAGGRSTRNKSYQLNVLFRPHPSAIPSSAKFMTFAPMRDLAPAFFKTEDPMFD